MSIGHIEVLGRRVRVAANSQRQPCGNVHIRSSWGCPLCVTIRQAKEQAQKAAQSQTKRLRAVLFERDGDRCCRCGSPEELTVDHIVPVSKGGPSVLENLQTLCRSCNCAKKDK